MLSVEIEELRRSQCGALASFSDEELERIGRLDNESTFSRAQRRREVRSRFELNAESVVSP